MAKIILSFKKSFLEKEGLTKEGMERCLFILAKEFRKAQDQHDFEYFKRRALACLRKQYKELEEKENEEKKVSKAFILAEAELEKAFPVGTIRTWKGKKFIKSPDKKWRPYYEKKGSQGEKLALAALAKKINSLKDGDYEGLYKLITLQRSRFTSDGSLIKDLYDAMRVRGALGNGRFTKKEEPKENEEEKTEKTTFTEEENRALAVLQSILPTKKNRKNRWSRPWYYYDFSKTTLQMGENNVHFDIGAVYDDNSLKGIIKNNIDCDERQLLAITTLITDAIINGKCIEEKKGEPETRWSISPTLNKKFEKNGVIISVYYAKEEYPGIIKGIDTETNKEAFEKAVKDFEAKIDANKECSDVFEFMKKAKLIVEKATIKKEQDDKKEQQKKEIEEVKEKFLDLPTAENMINYLNILKVKHNPLGKKRKNPLSDEQIIERLANFDGTGGSCASLTFCYVAQKMGYDVLDFRGGTSKETFAYYTDLVMPYLFKSVTSGHKEIGDSTHESALECLYHAANGPDGAQYILSAGRHLAIVRKNEVNGELQYLELQVGDELSDWKYFEKLPKGERGKLNKYGFSKDFEEQLDERFHTKSSYARVPMIANIDAGLKPGVEDDFLKLMGYINTKEGEQKVRTREEWIMDGSKLL